MAPSSIIEKTCRACLSRYTMLERRVAMKTRGEIACEVCGEVVFRWNGRTKYTECSVTYRGTLDSGRPNRFGPSRRIVETSFRGR